MTGITPLLMERERGWTGVIDPEKAYIVVENGRITDVVYGGASPAGPVSPTYDDPIMVIPRRPVPGEWVPDFPARPSDPVGYTGPTGPVITGPACPGLTGPRPYRALRGWN